MLLRQLTPRTRAAGPRRRPADGRRFGVPPRRRALDAAGLILELDMAALVRRAADSLRHDRDKADRRDRRSWWRRLFGDQGID
jgi:hypothetical protein